MYERTISKTSGFQFQNHFAILENNYMNELLSSSLISIATIATLFSEPTWESVKDDQSQVPTSTSRFKKAKEQNYTSETQRKQDGEQEEKNVIPRQSSAVHAEYKYLEIKSQRLFSEIEKTATEFENISTISKSTQTLTLSLNEASKKIRELINFIQKNGKHLIYLPVLNVVGSISDQMDRFTTKSNQLLNATEEVERLQNLKKKCGFTSDQKLSNAKLKCSKLELEMAIIELNRLKTQLVPVLSGSYKQPPLRTNSTVWN